MFSESLTIIFLISICLILGIALVAVLQDLFKLEKRLENSEKENAEFKEALQKEADIVIDDAHKEAMKVVDDANKKAIEMVNSAELYNQEAKATLKEDLTKFTQSEEQQLSRVGVEFQETYREAVEEVKQQSNQIVQNITKDIEKHAFAELTEFTETMKKETLASQNLIRTRIEQEYKSAEDDVQKFKAAEMEKARKDIFGMVKFLTESVLSKGLTIEQHQRLVLEALEEAKTQGVMQ